MVIFPETILHFDVARRKSVLALTEAMNNDQHIFITSQTDSTEDDPTSDTLYSVGVLTKILQIAKISGGVFRVVAQGVSRAKADSFNDNSSYIEAKITVPVIKSAPNSIKVEAMMNTVKDMFEEFAILNSHVPQDMILTAHDITDAGRLSDYIADNVIRDYRKKQEILETMNEEKRLQKIIKMFKRENNILAMEEEISERTKASMDENQKEYYLRERIKAIRAELGENDDTESELSDYREKISELKTTDENKKNLMNELRKLEKTAVRS